MSPMVSRKARDGDEPAVGRRLSTAVGRSNTRAGPVVRAKNSLHFSLRSELDEHKDWATTPQDVYNPRRQTMQARAPEMTAQASFKHAHGAGVVGMGLWPCSSTAMPSN